MRAYNVCMKCLYHEDYCTCSKQEALDRIKKELEKLRTVILAWKVAKQEVSQCTEILLSNSVSKKPGELMAKLFEAETELENLVD